MKAIKKCQMISCNLQCAIESTFESGEKHPSTGIPLLFKCPANVWSGCPLKASSSLIRLPFVVNSMDFPLGLKRNPFKRMIIRI